MARAIKEKYGFVHNLNEHIVVTLPTDGKPREFDLTQPLKAACQSILPGILDGIRDVIRGYDPEFQQSLLRNVLLGGGGGQLQGLDRLIEDGLQEYGGGNVTRVYDCIFSGAVGALKLAMSMPTENWEQLMRLDGEHRAAA